MTSCERILIVGGGIGGLTAALALSRNGYAPTVVERATTWAPLGAGIVLGPNATTLLESLGIAAELYALGHLQQTVAMSDAAGTERLEIDLGNVWPRGTCQLAIHRVPLLRVLVDHQRGSIRLGRTVTSLYPSPDGVAVELSDGTTAVYDLVVGADGIYSRTRELLFPSASVHFVGQSYWRGVVDASVVNDWTVQFGEDRFFGISPIAADRTYWFAQIRTDEPFDDPSTGRTARLRNRFADFGAPASTVLGLIGESGECHFGPIHEVSLHDWARDSVVLIGDAAHAMSPIMGQGGAMAIEDGVVLAEELHRGDTIGHALASFVERRRARVEEVRTQTHARLSRSTRRVELPSNAQIEGVFRGDYQWLASPP